MRKANRFLCVFLCITLLFLSVLVPHTFATATQGRIATKTDPAAVREKPNKSSTSLISAPKGSIVTINGKTNGQTVDAEYGATWYNITYSGKTGYVYGKYIEEITPPPYDEDFEKNLLNFPESYREALRTIHNAYPNWVFKADPINLSLDNAIDLEYNAKDMTKTKKWVELTYGLEWRDPRSKAVKAGDVDTRETRWTFASRKAIAFFMDPRNGLTVTATKASFPNIFTFMEQSYDEKTQTTEGLKNVIKGTFLENGYGDDKNAYMNDIMEAAKQSGVSPYVIAGTIIIEQGKGTSSLISGEYSGYEGYYNYFNYGAYGDNVVKNGLEYAKGANWNSRRESIIGGAKQYGSGYVGTGQDTYYYMDFNVFGNCTHQYASNVYDQCIKAYKVASTYTSNANGALTFRIPVYSKLPEKICAAPTLEEYMEQHQKYIEEPAQVTPAKIKGDVSGDGIVNGRDLAIIKLNLLGIKKLTVSEISIADVSGDGELNGRDLAIVKLYLLGLRKL